MTSIPRRVESAWNQGPFPHAGFASSGAASGTTDPSVIRCDPVTVCQVGVDTAPPQRTSRVASLTCVNVPSSLPRRSRRRLRSSCTLADDGSLPRNSGGSASALPISRPAQRSRMLRPAHLRTTQGRPLSRELRRSVTRPRRRGSYPAGATLAGTGLSPVGRRRLCAAHVESNPDAVATLDE